MKANRLLALVWRTLLCAGLATTAVACKKEGTKEAAKPGTEPATVIPAGPLSRLPQEASIVGGLNLDALRKGKLWASVIEAQNADPKDKKEYEDFKAQTGWDPVNSLAAVHFAIPADVDTSKEFGLLVTSTTAVDEKKLVAYFEAKAKEEKRSLLTAQHQGKTLYGVKEKNVDTWFAFIDGQTIAAGGPVWTKKIVEISAGQGSGVDKNPKLMGLVGRSNRAAVLWVAGDLPPDKGTTPLGITIKSLTAALDFPANGFKLDATTTTASPDEGKKLAELATQQLAQMKPMAGAMGLTDLLASLKVQQTAADVSFALSLTEPQLDQLVTKGKQMAAGMMASAGKEIAGKPPRGGGKGKGKAKRKRD